MKKQILQNHLTLIFLFVSYIIIAQNSSSLIRGHVFEKQTGEVLPFATISLKNQLHGTLANETGNFDFLLPENALNDTIVISYLGYKIFLIAVKNINTSLAIGLEQNTLELNEIVVKPQPPEFYIKLAILKSKYNYPKSAFESHGYYREKILENKKFIRYDEGIFKSYYPNYIDSLNGQHQLMLHRKEENTHEVVFRMEERKKAEQKRQRKNKKRSKKGKSEKNDDVDIDMVGDFSGPQSILDEANFLRHRINFLDTLKFKKYNYAFEKSSTYDNKELMVINFTPKKKVEMMLESGKIYIDVASHAIVKIESTGDFIVPAIIKPILFLYSIGVDDPKFDRKIEFQKINNLWYPKNIQMNIQVQLTNKHFFKKDEISEFDIDAIYTVIRMNVDRPLAIPKAKRFDEDKAMEIQAYNDENLNWSKINVIKK